MTRRVAVLGSQVVQDLGVTDPNVLIGEPIRIGGIRSHGMVFSTSDDQHEGERDPHEGRI